MANREAVDSFAWVCIAFNRYGFMVIILCRALTWVFFQPDHYYAGQKLRKTDKHVSIVDLLLLLLPVIQLCPMIEIQIGVVYSK